MNNYVYLIYTSYIHHIYVSGCVRAASVPELRGIWTILQWSRPRAARTMGVCEQQMCLKGEEYEQICIHHIYIIYTSYLHQLMCESSKCACDVRNMDNYAIELPRATRKIGVCEQQMCLQCEEYEQMCIHHLYIISTSYIHHIYISWCVGAVNRPEMRGIGPIRYTSYIQHIYIN